MKTKVGIVIPVRNCLDYTKAAVASIKTKHPYEVVVISDRSTDGTMDWLKGEFTDKDHQNHTAMWDLEGSTGLAWNWNYGIRHCIDRLHCTHILVANNDILLHPQTIDNLVDRIDRGDLVMATGVNVQGACPAPTDIFTLEVGEPSETEHPDFSCFMITPETIEKIGWFDEHFRGAYCEDCDYHARIALANEIAITYNAAPYYHYASGTVRSNPQLAGEIHQRHNDNEQYFRTKWGITHVSDTPLMRDIYWKHPFNDPAKTIKDW